MGKRGPQPGAKAAREAAAREAAAKLAAEGAATPLSSTPAEPPSASPEQVTPAVGMAALATPGGARWLMTAATESTPPEEQGDDEDTGFTPMDGALGMPPAPPPPAPPPAPAPAAPLTFAERENPERLTGDALRELAHRRGIARSTLADLSDERIRTELRYITHRQYSEEGIA